MSWDQIPLGYCVTEVKKKNTGGREDNLLSLSYGNIVRRDIATADGLLPESFDSYNVINPGDTVLRLTDLQNDQRSLRVGLVEEVGIITSAYVTVRPSKVMHPKFLNYFLKHMDFRKDFYALGAGVRQSLKFDELRSVKVPVPALAEQKVIADYLDRETARIDSLIKKKRRMVELIQHRLRAITSETLYGGSLSKDKGVRLRFICSVNPQTIEWHKFSDDDEIAFLPLEAVWPRNLDMSRMRSKHAVSTGYTRFKEGDVIVPKITPTFEGDRSTRVEGVPTFIAAGTTELHVVRPTSKSDMRYLDHIFSTHQFLDGGEANMVGVAGQKRVPDDWIRDFRVFHTDIEIQVELAERLDREFDRTKIMIEKSNSHITLLFEFRQALITAAVTGEIKIPEAAA